MAFSDVRDLRASKKTALVRLNPAKDVSADLVLDSGTTYDFTFSEAVSSIVLDGVEIDPGDWTQIGDSTSVDLGVALTTQVVVAEFYVFLASGPSVYLPEDITTGTEREWQSRIPTPPKVIESNENITEGILSVSSTNFTALNTDRRFNDLLDINISFVDREVKIWYGLDDEYIQVYQGFMSTPFLQGQQVQFTIKSALSPLKGVALMGDSMAEAFASEIGYPDIPTVSNLGLNKAIPMVFGRSSPHASRGITTLNSDTGAIEERGGQRYDEKNQYMLRPVCIETNPAESLLSFRRWAICRLPPGISLYTPTTELIDSSDVSFSSPGSPDPDEFIFSNVPASISDFIQIGDRLHIRDSGAFFGWSDTNVKSVSGTTVTVIGAGSIVGDVNIRLPSIHLQVAVPYTNENLLDLLPIGSVPDMVSSSRKYLIETETTAGGGTLVKILWVDGGEDTLSIIDTLTTSAVDPNVEWLARVITSGPVSHADAVKSLMEGANLPTLASSFTAAESALSSEVGFLIPIRTDRVVKPYLKYLQQILPAALSYLSIGPDALDNDLFKFSYALLPDTVTTPTITVTEEQLSENSLVIKYEESELITELRMSNREFEQEISDSSAILESLELKHLINRPTSIDQEHSLLDTQRAQDILDFRSTQKRTYSFKTKTSQLDAKLGDTVRLQVDNLPKNSAFVDLFIIYLNKGPSGVRVKAIELGE